MTEVLGLGIDATEVEFGIATSGPFVLNQVTHESTSTSLVPVESELAYSADHLRDPIGFWAMHDIAVESASLRADLRREVGAYTRACVAYDAERAGYEDASRAVHAAMGPDAHGGMLGRSLVVDGPPDGAEIRVYTKAVQAGLEAMGRAMLVERHAYREQRLTLSSRMAELYRWVSCAFRERASGQDEVSIFGGTYEMQEGYIVTDSGDDTTPVVLGPAGKVFAYKAVLNGGNPPSNQEKSHAIKARLATTDDALDFMGMLDRVQSLSNDS